MGMGRGVLGGGNAEVKKGEGELTGFSGVRGWVGGGQSWLRERTCSLYGVRIVSSAKGENPNADTAWERIDVAECRGKRAGTPTTRFVLKTGTRGGIVPVGDNKDRLRCKIREHRRDFNSGEKMILGGEKKILRRWRNHFE